VPASSGAPFERAEAPDTMDTPADRPEDRIEADSREPTSAELRAARRRAGEWNRGRKAESPSEIPVRGWKDIVWRVWGEFNRTRIMSVAAGVTFYVLLSIFPTIAALVSLYGFVADRALISRHLNLLSGFLPTAAIELLGTEVTRIAGQPEATLSGAFFFGLAVSLWSANAGMKGLFEAMNVVYGEDEKRSLLAVNILSLCCTLALIAFVLFTLAALVIAPLALRSLGFASSSETLLSLLRWPLLSVVVLLGLSALYRYGPSRHNAQWKWVTPGSVLATLLWLAGSGAFSWYVAHFGRYNLTYGSLGAAVAFMTWIWLSTIIILLGGQLNAEMEHQTSHDTTVGPTKPLGSRRAHMADTLGQGIGKT
jgi:membrane protein